ncbi:MAG: methionine synthase [Frankiales bacterium]|nr:methionine synthase [Frankiales bacterium]
MADTPPDPLPAAATAVGSMPGTDVREAVAVVVGELGQGDGVPHLPELPARGPGADLVGRTAGLLAAVSPDLAVETTPTGWRFADAPGREARRAASWLGEDLDAWEEALTGFRGRVDASLAGPWTLAATVELRSGERAVRDPGACRDLAEALAAAVADHVAELRRRLPGARIGLWLDEPALPAVLAGSLPTRSGLGRLAAVDDPVVEAGLRTVLDAIRAAGAEPVVHCCAERPPYDLLVRSGAAAVSVDLTRHDRRDDDAVGELVEAGRVLVAGVQDPTGPAASPVGASVGLVQDLGHRLGHGPEATASWVQVSPTCGMAGASPARARATLERLREVGRALRDEEPDRGEG